jgi:hypothetical protein
MKNVTKFLDNFTYKEKSKSEEFANSNELRRNVNKRFDLGIAFNDDLQVKLNYLVMIIYDHCFIKKIAGNKRDS